MTPQPGRRFLRMMYRRSNPGRARIRCRLPPVLYPLGLPFIWPTMPAPPQPDPYTLWPLLLAPLADVKQNPAYHPEGDALYHSLQAFELARAEFPYDHELIAAALLHDVGKAIDPQDHVAAGLEALEGTHSPSVWNS